MTEPNQLHRNGFLATLTREHASEGTKRKYRGYVQTYLNWVGDRHPRDITRAEVEFEYLPECYPEGCAAATERAHLAALDRFYDHLDARGLLTDETGRAIRPPIHGIKLPKRKQKPNDYLRPDEDAALLNAPMNPTERAIIYTLRYTGVRVDELCALRVSDVDMERGLITVEKSKTDSGIRELPIFDQLRPVLYQHLDKLRLREDYSSRLPFFPTKEGTATKTVMVWRIVKRVAERADVRVRDATDKARFNVSEVTPHTLRRTCGSWLYQNGASLDVVSKLLGHSSTAITEKAYAQLLPERIEDDLRKAAAA
jgi:integrase/recombinase XerD